MHTSFRFFRSATLLKQQRLGVPPNKGQILRAKVIARLRQSPYLETNFVVRDNSFFGLTDQPELSQRYNDQYFENIFNSDYVICCRGSANYSVRLFEVLNCGRIPLFINTDCELPWDSEIDWKQYCVWVEENELDRIGDKVRDFHQQLTPDAFVELQYRCRDLWKQWLSPEGFFTHFQQYALQNLIKPC